MSEEYFHFEDIKRAGRVVPLDVVRKILKRTEPVTGHLIRTDGSTNISVSMPTEWNVELKKQDDSILTSCKVTLEDQTYTLTKRAILTLLNLMGITDRYAYKAPGHLLEPHVEYWLRNDGVGRHEEVKMVTKDNYVVGFMSPELPIISNLEVLDQIEKYVKESGESKHLFVDPNIVHNYVETDFRLVLSEEAFEVETDRGGDKETDKWHFGIHVSNSLLASHTRPLALSGFMLEQRSLAGIIPEYSSPTGFTRTNSVSVDVDDVRGWIHSTLDQIFAILPAEAQMIQHMPEHRLTGKVGVFTTDLFRSMKIHRKVQELALENLTESGDMTPYGIMHAMGKAVGAGVMDFSPKIVHHIQKVCGTLPARTDEICDSCGRLHLFS